MKTETQKLTDVALERPENAWALPLSEVGLEKVQTVVLFKGQKQKALVDVSVSLDDANARGIHMSRLYKVVSKLAAQELNWGWLHANLDEILLTHQGLSNTGRLRVHFEAPVSRPSLLSAESGWRTYPLTFEVSHDSRGRHSRLGFEVLYSSTCPCSTSLSQQAFREAFASTFREDRLSREQILNWLESAESMVATPHAQRSEARCDLIFNRGSESADTLQWIDLVEMTLGTPVQTAVKREDELEFARLNARHQMFCEDAARKLKAALLERPELADFMIEVRHFESLHAHDVVARARKLD